MEFVGLKRGQRKKFHSKEFGRGNSPTSFIERRL